MWARAESHRQVPQVRLRQEQGEGAWRPSHLLQGIITADGPEWTSQRRFALKHLKDFGFGRSGLEGVIQGEVEDLVTLLAGHTGRDFRMETVSGGRW